MIIKNREILVRKSERLVSLCENEITSREIKR